MFGGGCVKFWRGLAFGAECIAQSSASSEQQAETNKNHREHTNADRPARAARFEPPEGGAKRVRARARRNGRGRQPPVLSRRVARRTRRRPGGARPERRIICAGSERDCNDVPRVERTAKKQGTTMNPRDRSQDQDGSGVADRVNRDQRRIRRPYRCRAWETRRRGLTRRDGSTRRAEDHHNQRSAGHISAWRDADDKSEGRRRRFSESSRASRATSKRARESGGCRPSENSPGGSRRAHAQRVARTSRAPKKTRASTTRSSRCRSDSTAHRRGFAQPG